ncbi:single-stranded DNA-binding protein [Coriobacteriales bacterium OH1046]|nr:single-stranded DNA-binding protein [Coriobacteriales bacterium OH1046]
MSINRVNISGNLTRDPEMRQTAGGTQILQFGVAVNDRRRNPQTGEWEDVPNFVDCVVFGSRAEPLSRFLSKGTKVAIEGKLRYSAWETKDGQRRSKLEIVVDDVEFLSPRGDQGGQGGYQQGSGYQQVQQAPASGYPAPGYSAPSYAAPAPPAAAPSVAPPPSDVYDEDIPF